jgi:hypothetical protein
MWTWNKLRLRERGNPGGTSRKAFRPTADGLETREVLSSAGALAHSAAAFAASFRMNNPAFTFRMSSPGFSMPAATSAFSPQSFPSSLLSTRTPFAFGGVNNPFMSTPVRPAASFTGVSTPSFPGLASAGGLFGGGTSATSPFTPQNPVSPAETNPSHPPTGGWLTYNGATYNSMLAFNTRNPNLVLPFPIFPM